MSRWWRAYDDAVNNPKLQRLPATLFKAWFNLCCLTSKNNGELPTIKDVAFSLRVSEQKAAEIIDALVDAKMLDRDGDTVKPHDWQHYQYQSDSSTERVRRYREGKGNVSRNVSVTPQNRAETDTEQNRTEDRAADAAPRARVKRACSFPDDFTLNDERRAVALRHGIPEARVAGVFEHFRDDRVMKGKTFKDWDAAWRTWCRNDEKFGGHNGNGPGAGSAAGNANRRSTGADAVIAGFGKVADRRAGRSDDRRQDSEIPPGRYELDLGATR